MIEPTVRDAARAAARLKLAGLLPGQTGANFVNEIADAVLDAAEPVVRVEVLASAADDITAHCFTHNPSAATGWTTCHCEVADDLRRQATAPH